MDKEEGIQDDIINIIPWSIRNSACDIKHSYIKYNNKQMSEIAFEKQQESCGKFPAHKEAHTA